MKEIVVSGRDSVLSFVYQKVFKRVFFKIDPEKVHDRFTHLGMFMGRHYPTRKITSALYCYANPRLQQTVLGIPFANPIGLSAGFDKDAVLTDIIPSIGFGFAEVGSITGEPCEGNPKPRLWRLRQSKSLMVYYGLKNEGCERIRKRLQHKTFRIPVGISIAKTNCSATVDTKAGIEDYVKAFRHFTTIGSYFTINISCPNAFGGQPFTDPKKLDLLLTKIDAIDTTKPIFLKLSPDLSKYEIDEIIAISRKHRVQGFICTNLTKIRNNPKIIEEKVQEKGGLSGKVVEDLSNELIRYIYTKTRGQFVIIGCGGVFSAEDAYRKIKLGASLIQLITGMIFEGPSVISRINQGLVQLLERDGFQNIAEAVGSFHCRKRAEIAPAMPESPARELQRTAGRT